MLEDDTVLAIRSWIDRRTGELPQGFATAVRDWLLVLLDGDARSRPRSHTTIYVYFAEVRPLIDHWSADRSHIREVTGEDIRAGLGQLRGHPLRDHDLGSPVAIPVRQEARADLHQPRPAPEGR